MAKISVMAFKVLMVSRIVPSGIWASMRGWGALGQLLT
jgi:hypothetical protein